MTALELARQLKAKFNDLIADPVEFRLKPALEEGEPFATGTLVHSFGIKEAIRQAAQAIEKLFEAGSTSVVLCVAPSEGLAEQIAYVGREVLPRL